MVRPFPLALIRLSISRPVMPSMRMSLSTMEISCVSNRARPSSQVAAVSTW